VASAGIRCVLSGRIIPVRHKSLCCCGGITRSASNQFWWCGLQERWIASDYYEMWSRTLERRRSVANVDVLASVIFQTDIGQRVIPGRCTWTDIHFVTIVARTVLQQYTRTYIHLLIRIKCVALHHSYLCSLYSFFTLLSFPWSLCKFGVTLRQNYSFFHPRIL